MVGSCRASRRLGLPPLGRSLLFAFVLVPSHRTCISALYGNSPTVHDFGRNYSLRWSPATHMIMRGHVRLRVAAERTLASPDRSRQASTTMAGWPTRGGRPRESARPMAPPPALAGCTHLQRALGGARSRRSVSDTRSGRCPRRQSLPRSCAEGLEIVLQVLPGVIEVGSRLLEEGVGVATRREFEDLLDLRRGHDSLPVRIGDEGLKGALGQVLPLAMQALCDVVWQTDRDFHLVFLSAYRIVHARSRRAA